MDTSFKCCHCKLYYKESDVTVIYKTKNKYDNLIKYYMCNVCNNKRIRAYGKTEIGRKKINEAVKKSTMKHWHKQYARLLVSSHIKSGKLIKSSKCENCGESPKKIEGHHTNYSKPLEVVWLCKKCHRLADKIINNNL